MSEYSHMNSQWVELSNAARARMAIEAVRRRSPGLPGFVCFYGAAGSGKSTLMVRMACDYDAAYLYLPPLGRQVTGSWLLRELVSELGSEPSRYTSENFRSIIEMERRESRMIVVDECENGLVKKRKPSQRRRRDCVL